MKSVYGSGFVVKVTDSSITIEFDNGREANFSTDIFEKGIVKFIV